MFCQTHGEHRPNSFIVDADGGNVALVCYFANEEEENRIGNLIVDAVNERDYLRDLVRRLCDELDSHYHEPVSMDDPCIIREARAAIGGETE